MKESFRSRFPLVRGRLRRFSSLRSLTWLRTGGPAIVFEPFDVHDLRDFLASVSQKIAMTPLGSGANVLIRDGGISGVVVRLGSTFQDVDVKENGMTCGAAVRNGRIASLARDSELGGLAFFSGIPGSLGGSIWMNAGAYDCETGCVVDWVEIVERCGALHRLSAREVGFSYRSTNLPAGSVVVRARLLGHPADKESIRKEMSAIRRRRGQTQPLGIATAGSIFKNPPGREAWRLIDAAGCRDLAYGDARLSVRHCNFFHNKGSASGAQLEHLGESVRKRIVAHSGIRLSWEVQRFGEIPMPTPPDDVDA